MREQAILVEQEEKLRSKVEDRIPKNVMGNKPVHTGTACEVLSTESRSLRVPVTAGVLIITEGPLK